MDYYANPPLMLVEFGTSENDAPSSPLGSPPSTPQHQPSLFFTAERSTPTPTSSQRSGMKRIDDTSPEHLLQPTDDDEDIPMDELRHYQVGNEKDPLMIPAIKSSTDDGPDDEKLARKTISAISPSRNMEIETWNPPPPRNRGQPMSPSQRLAYNRSNSGQMKNNGTTNQNGMVKNGSVKDLASRYETSPMKTPEKEDLLSPPKLLLKKAELWKDSPAIGSRLPPSSTKRPTTRNRSSFQRKLDDDDDVPDDERPSITRIHTIDIPEDERMANESEAAKARFARSAGRSPHVNPPKNGVKMTSDQSAFAGELTRRLEIAQTEGMNPPEKADLQSSSPPRNRNDGPLIRNSPRKPTARRLNYDGGDDQPGRDDSIRAEILHDSNNEVDPTMTQNLRRMRLAEDSPSRIRASSTSPSAAPVPVYPPRVSSSLAASLKSILESIPKTQSLWDLKTYTPVPVPSLESFVGIAKGDLTLSLLPHETNSLAEESSKRVSGADRVQSALGAILRVRKATGMLDLGKKSAPPASPLRPPQPVDSDDVIGMHEAAISHLLVNDTDRALGCYREILSLYKIQQENYSKGPPSPRNEARTDFELSMSLVLHNLGILNLLKKKYFTAMTYFGNALDTRTACLVEGHLDQMASLAKLFICQCALDQFDDSQGTLQRAVKYGRRHSSLPLEDQLLLAEMMNNLGTLHCRKGIFALANDCFVGSFDILKNAASDCLYEETLTQSVSLNISIVRANAGFAKMAAKTFKEAIPDLENALLGLHGRLTNGDEISVAIMDCLAAANLLSGRKDRARKMYARVLQILQNEFDHSDPRISKTMSILGSTESGGRSAQAALQTLEQSFALEIATT